MKEFKIDFVPNKNDRSKKPVMFDLVSDGYVWGVVHIDIMPYDRNDEDGIYQRLNNGETITFVLKEWLDD